MLNGVTTTIRGGELIALVGHNGSGKTTLAKVIAGLYQPTGGAIVWNGTSRALLDDAAVRRSVAMAFQDFARFELPVYDNVAFGNIGAYGNRDAVIAASRAAGIAPVVEALSDGYDTRLSRSYEGGAELSGGQWQRLGVGTGVLP